MLYDEMNEFRKASLGRDVNFLSVTVEKDLWGRWCKNHDPQARDRILESHLPLCRALSLEWARRSSVPVQDLFGEAILAMTESFPDAYPKLKGGRHYNPDHESGARFCTFIHWRIESALQEYTIKTTAPVKVATTKSQKSMFSNWERMNDRVMRENPGIGDQKRHEKIAEIVSQKHPNTRARDVRDFENRMKSRFMSLDKPINDDQDSSSFIDFLVDKNSTPEAYYDGQDNALNLSLMQDALSSLTPRERDVIVSRYLQDEGKKKQTDLGAQYGVSSQRICQIETEALQKMKRFIQRGPVTLCARSVNKDAQGQTTYTLTVPKGCALTP